MINNNDRIPFGEDENNGDADRIFNPKEQYTVSIYQIISTKHIISKKHKIIEFFNFLNHFFFVLIFYFKMSKLHQSRV